MPTERQALALIALCGWVALWWLAVRVVCGRRFGPFEWAPVAFLAFGVPLLVADVAATSPRGFSDGQFLVAWGGVALVIDAGWAAWRVWHRQSRRRVGLQYRFWEFVAHLRGPGR